MLQHVVALTWNDSVPQNYAEVVNKVLHEMAKTIPSVRSYRCGADLGVSSHANANYLIVAEFDDVAGWREYDENPLHNEVRAKYFAPYVASRVASQITF
jgi:hypothetical protein